MAVGFGSFGRGGSRCRGRRACRTGAGGLGRRTSRAIGTGIDEGKTFEGYFQFALLLMGILIFPLVELEPAFNEQWTAFFHVLRDNLRLTSKGIYVHEGHFFLS